MNNANDNTAADTVVPVLENAHDKAIDANTAGHTIAGNVDGNMFDEMPMNKVLKKPSSAKKTLKKPSSAKKPAKAIAAVNTSAKTVKKRGRERLNTKAHIKT